MSRCFDRKFFETVSSGTLHEVKLSCHECSSDPVLFSIEEFERNRLRNPY